MYAVSFCTAMNAHVHLHCQVLPILCCDMRIPAIALRQVFPWNGFAYNVFTNITNCIIITGHSKTRKRQILLYFINYFLVVFTFLIDWDICSGEFRKRYFKYQPELTDTMAEFEKL